MSSKIHGLTGDMLGAGVDAAFKGALFGMTTRNSGEAPAWWKMWDAVDMAGAASDSVFSTLDLLLSPVTIANTSCGGGNPGTCDWAVTKDSYYDGKEEFGSGVISFGNAYRGRGTTVFDVFSGFSNRFRTKSGTEIKQIKGMGDGIELYNIENPTRTSNLVAVLRENTRVDIVLMLGVAVIEVRVWWCVIGCVGGCLVSIIRGKRDSNMDLSDRGRSGKE